MPVKILLVIFPVLFFCATSMGKEVLALEDCLQQVFKNNLKIKSYHIQAEMARLEHLQAWYNILPTFGAEYNHNWSFGRSLNQESYSWETDDMQQGSLAARTGLTVFEGFYKLYDQKYTKSRAKGAISSIKKQELLLGLEAVRVYHELLLSIKNIEILELTNTDTQSGIDKLKEQINAGTSAKAGLYELLAQSKKEQLQLKSQESKREKYYLALEKIMHWPNKKAFGIDTRLPGDSIVFQSRKMLFDSLLAQVVKKSALVKEKDWQVNSMKYKLKMQKTLYSPSLQASASLSSRYLNNAIDPLAPAKDYGYLAQVEDNFSKQVGITVSIPIYDRQERKTRIKLAEQQLQDALNDRKIMVQDLKTMLFKIEKDIIGLEEQIKVASKMVGYYKKSLEVATEKFAAGIINSYEMNLARSNWTGSRLELNKLKIEYNMNLEMLNLYMEK